MTPFPVYPTDTGGRIRTARIFEHIAREHHVTAICFRPDDVSDEQLALMQRCADRVESVEWRAAAHYTPAFYAEVAASLPGPLPYTVRKYRSAAMRRRVAALLAREEYDVLVCDFLQPAVNCLDVRVRPKVLFQHNVEAEIFKRQAAAQTNPLARALFGWEYVKLARFEARACQAFDGCIAVSERDAEILRDISGSTPIRAVPTGVDVDYFAPVAGLEQPDTVVFVGSMDWLPNQDAVQFFIADILPRIRERANVRFVVVGRNPPAAVKRQAEITPGVEVTGTVDDVRPYLARAALVVIPLRIGGGTRIKAYEAMAMERMVLSTSIGAEGLPVVDGTHLALADDAQTFADRAVELLRSPETRARMGAAARAFVAANASWATAAEEFVAFCEETIRRKEAMTCD